MSHNTSPINFSRKDNSYRSSNDDRTHPTDAPQSKKDFKRIMQKNDDDPEDDDALAKIAGEQDPENIAKGEGAVVNKKGSPSLFDLNQVPAKKTGLPSGSSHEAGDIDSAMEMQNSSKSKTDTVDATERGLAESPSDAYARLINKRDGSRDDSFNPSGGGSGSNSKESFTTRFATEQTDLSYVNPLSLAGNQSITNFKVEGEKVLPANNIQDIVNKLVEAANEMKYDGKTETTITLKHPPILAGASLVVTGFDNAQKEFNISFENLSQAGQNLLSQQNNQESLLHALEAKGYAVHILTVTTETIHQQVESNPLADRQREEGGRGDGSDNSRQKKRGQG